MEKRLECPMTGFTDADMPAETVARATRDKPENRRSSDEPFGHFIHGAIAADRYD